MVKLLIGVTGSVATIKLPILVNSFLQNDNFQVRVVVTKHAKHFYEEKDLPSNVPIYTDEDEWNSWSGRGDPVLHIELVKWADVFLIAPLDANSMAKIANGLCDNLLTCVVRAWERTKPLIFCPAMNTKMYEHPITEEHLLKLKSWGYKEIAAIEKTLMCGDTGIGAMAETSTIVAFVQKYTC
ncbi:phosphopantothenoylcysteine decarboxylase [Aethina tumida]|uniref:phosphopantothenoylcysteine decarboxylase n=1 Tax=Aethina tumida TaxID=116153 RepID=UPI00096B3383|nr:phosphopantothenoylcysteine decarboxylase [Aethina tumida]